MGTVAFKVSIQYCTASKEFFLWADDTAIITLASPMGTTLQSKRYGLLVFDNYSGIECKEITNKTTVRWFVAQISVYT